MAKKVYKKGGFEQTWCLPNSPYRDSEGNSVWTPVVRVGRYIPFGYEQDPEDPDILLPIHEELELLEKAKIYLRRYSLRQVANWLTEESGRYISHEGLRKRVNIERSRKAQASIHNQYARRAQEASEKARRIQENRIGGKTLYENRSSRRKAEEAGDNSSSGETSED
jgi:hypothetical protein